MNTTNKYESLNLICHLLVSSFELNWNLAAIAC